MGISKRAAVALLVVFVIISAAVVGVGASPSASGSQTMQVMEGGPVVVLRRDPSTSQFRVPPPQYSRLGALSVQGATINVNYLPGGTKDVWNNDCYTWSNDARTAFDYAVSIWESLVNSSVPIEIDACWTELGSYILGQASADSYYANFSGAPQSSTWYSVALANTLHGSDLNGATAEMYISYNRAFDWYYGTDGNTPGDEIDLASVVLHEITHGLGFAGSMIKIGALGYWNWGNPSSPIYPAIYDRFTEEGSGGAGTPLISYGSQTVALGSALTSEDVFFDGANANAANGGSPPELYAPSTWASGSSYSHLAQSYDGTQNALMTYSISDGESIHDPGPVALGILKDIGWMVGDADLRIVKRVANGGLGYEPGDPVTFTLSIENIGENVAEDVVVTDTLSSDIQSPWYTASPGISYIGGTYVWSVPDLSPGASGVITVYGTINGSLPPDFAIWNTASIGTGSSESETINNSSTVLVWGRGIYLPLTVRDY